MSVCPSFVGARVIRVTRLDNCGRPVYGPDSQVVTKGLVSVNMDPDVEEGEDFTQRNINGDLCVSEQGPDALRWINVGIEFCQVDPCLWSILNPSWKLVKNAHGEVTGFRIGERFDDSAGFALEMWPKVSAQGALCDDDAPDEADPNGYFLLPYVIGRAPDGWSLENGVTTFTLNGRTKKGSLWGKGPYNVTLDADGNPVPLLEPISSGAGGEDPEHFHADIVTLSPPEPTCGCQPLEPIAPSVEGGQITVDAEQPNRACFTVQGSAARQVTIDWGDGSDPVTSRVGREECHLYSEEGTFTVSLCDIDADPGDEDMCTTTDVTIDEVPALPDPVIEVTPTSGDAPLSVTLTVNNHGNGRVLIDWGDGGEPTEHEGGDEDEPVTFPHQYLAGRAEPYVITVTAVQDNRSSATVEVQVNSDEPAQAPEVSADPATGPAPLATTLTINNHGQGDVVVDFGDGTDPQVIDGGDAENPATLDHTYADAGEYTVTVTDQSGSELSSTVTITVDEPTPAEPPTIVADPNSGAGPLEVSFTSDNHGNGPVTLDAGDGSEPISNAGDGTDTSVHTYADAGEYTVTATSDADPGLSSTTTVTVTDEEPTPDAPALEVSPATGPAPLEVTAAVDNHGNGPVTISWGDGSEPVEVADGESATHTYTDAGEYTVEAASAADETATATEPVTVEDAPAPQTPVLTVTPPTGEAPLTVQYTVDNHDQGPVTLDAGDGSEPISNAGDGTTVSEHTYAEPGTYTVTATSDADPDVTVEETVEVTAPEPAPEPVVAAPTGVAVADATSEELEVAWEWEAGDGPDVTGFEVRYRTPAETGEWSEPSTVAGTERSHLLDGLAPETTYEVGVTALADDARSEEVVTTGDTTA